MHVASTLLVLPAACMPEAPQSLVPKLVSHAIEAARPHAIDAASADGYRELVHGRDMAQGVELAHGATSFALVTLERASGSDAFDRSTMTLDAGFAVQCVASRQAWELYVAGTTSNGETVIERWRVQPPHGARTLVGGPARAEGLVSGVYIPVAERPQPAARVARTLLLRSTELGGARLVLVDPDGRFVLALSAGGELLVQVSTEGEPALLARFTADALPALRTACTAFAGDHVREGRVFAFEATGEHDGWERALLVDRDADGWFEDVRACDAECWAASGFQGATWLWSTTASAR